MEEKDYQQTVLNRFKKVRRKLDKNIEDYYVKEFDKNRDYIYENTYGFLSEQFSDYGDSTSEEPNSHKKSKTKLKKNYSGMLYGVSFSSLTFELG